MSLSTKGIKALLFNLDANKAAGPDKIPSYMLKHCTHEISPILKVGDIVLTEHRNTTC